MAADAEFCQYLLAAALPAGDGAAHGDREEPRMQGELAGLELRMEHNLVEHASYLHHGMPGMTVRQEADVLIADSGLDDDTFNFVGGAAFAAADAPARITQTVHELARTDRPFAWRVGPASRPANLSALLRAAGLPLTAVEPAMWAWLSDRAARAARSLEIVPVRTRAQLRDWSWVLAANWDPPAQTVVDFYAVTADRALCAGSPARFLLGYSEGRPVCTAEVLVHDGVAGLYSITTIASQQRRGFGTAITAAAMAAGRALGAPVAVLQASEQGEQVYRRLGFRVLGQVTEHAVVP